MLANRMGAIAAHLPAGSSNWAFAQQLRDGQLQKFHKFDFLDAEKNMQAYGQPTPPVYNYENVTSRYFVVFNSQADPFSSQEHVERMSQELPYGFLEMHTLPKNLTYTHTDFLYADNVGDLIHRDILRLLQTVQ